MGMAEWMRVIDTVSGLAQMSGKLRPKAAPEGGMPTVQEGAAGASRPTPRAGSARRRKKRSNRNVTRRDPEAGQSGRGAGRLETHLAGVVVAALKEAFDRDRTRMDLERAQVEAERRRAEEALATELRRQATERALGQLRLIAVMAVAAWMLSAALAVWLPGMRSGFPRALLGTGWVLAFAA